MSDKYKLVPTQFKTEYNKDFFTISITQERDTSFEVIKNTVHLNLKNVLDLMQELCNFVEFDGVK